MHRWLRAGLVYVVGIGLILFGIVGLVLPLHPGLVVIALGLGVLSLESQWARQARRRLLAWLAERDVQSDRLEDWQERIDERFLDGDETSEGAQADAEPGDGDG